MAEYRNMGTFFIPSGHAVITDPCYEDSRLWTQVDAEGAYDLWLAYYDGSWGRRVTALYAVKNGYAARGHDLECLDAREIGGAGVDSGQMCICDSESFSQDLYDIMGNLTLSDAQGGVFDGGGVSASGCGDGVYPVYELLYRGDTVGWEVDFLYEQEEEDEEDW